MLLRSRLSLVLGVVLFLLGSLVTAAVIVRTDHHTFRAWMTAPVGTPWTLWMPMPVEPMAFQADEGVRVETVDTSYGRMLNATGVGNATIFASLDRTRIEWEPGNVMPDAIDLTGRHNLSEFWVRRLPGGTQGNITVAGESWVLASYFGGGTSCTGPGFRGELEEGWTLVPPAFGDCVAVTDGTPWLYILAPPFFFLGGVFVVRSVKWRRNVSDGAG